MKTTIVRPATMDDVEAIQAVHAFCDDPWAHPATNAIWINHRLLRGFAIDVALYSGRVVGHAEWVASDEPTPYGRFLYLGLLQVHRDYQGLGAGKAMVEAGIMRAGSLGCSSVYTIPDDGSEGFYRKCGFACAETIYSAQIAKQPATLPAGWQRIKKVPKKAIRTLPFRLGWAQASATHMWELCNHPIPEVDDTAHHPCAQGFDGAAFVQLRYLGGSGALALAWAKAGVPFASLVDACMGLAKRLPITTLDLLIPGHELEPANPVVGSCQKAYESWRTNA